MMFIYLILGFNQKTFNWTFHKVCRNPTLGQVWRWDSHSQKWELGVLRDSRNFKARLQRSKHLSPWGVLYTVGKALKCRCRKWPCMSHSDICSTSYDQKKGQESNWQFDSRPQKVGNQPDPGVHRWSATHHWKALKALEENYKFALDLIPIRGLSRELWTPKVPGVQTRTISRFLLGSLGNKSHLDAGATEQRR
jgi:hypothetical protein